MLVTFAGLLKQVCFRVFILLGISINAKKLRKLLPVLRVGFDETARLPVRHGINPVVASVAQ